MDECILALEFDAHFKNVDMARDALKGVCDASFGQDADRINEVMIAATEAMNNAVEHSGARTVRMEVSRAETALHVVILTEGPQFDPTVVAGGLSAEDMLKREEGGYGLYLIRKLVDHFIYEYRNGCNVWSLVKTIDGEGGGNRHGCEN